MINQINPIGSRVFLIYFTGYLCLLISPIALLFLFTQNAYYLDSLKIALPVFATVSYFNYKNRVESFHDNIKICSDYIAGPKSIFSAFFNNQSIKLPLEQLKSMDKCLHERFGVLMIGDKSAAHIRIFRAFYRKKDYETLKQSLSELLSSKTA